MRGIGRVISVALLILVAGCAVYTLSLVLLFLSAGGALASLPQPGPTWFLLVPLIIIAANLRTLMATEGFQRWSGVTVIAVVSDIVGIILVAWIWWPPEIAAVDWAPVSLHWCTLVPHSVGAQVQASLTKDGGVCLGV